MPTPPDFDLDALRGEAPVLLLFAPYVEHDGYVAQKQILAAAQGRLERRRLVMLDVVGEDQLLITRGTQPPTRQTAPDQAAKLRTRFEASLDRLTLVLLDEAGQELLRERRAQPAHRIVETLDHAGRPGGATLPGARFPGARLPGTGVPGEHR